ncbi:MAG: hypothetical protein PUK54_02745 [Firmicutes bacterium]|nr:hypothetical protein [Bacillota bacterium]MDD7601514.1 hypothetical protein [Bacillota bacterium]MDY5855397.1 hypothetical protein [Anaerovoracaceae bacterium]
MHDLLSSAKMKNMKQPGNPYNVAKCFTVKEIVLPAALHGLCRCGRTADFRAKSAPAAVLPGGMDFAMLFDDSFLP